MKMLVHMPMPAASASAAEPIRAGLPSIAIVPVWPDRRLRAPGGMFISVVLPAPFSPSKPRNLARHQHQGRRSALAATIKALRDAAISIRRVPPALAACILPPEFGALSAPPLSCRTSPTRGDWLSLMISPAWKRWRWRNQGGRPISLLVGEMSSWGEEQRSIRNWRRLVDIDAELAGDDRPSLRWTISLISGGFSSKA